MKINKSLVIMLTGLCVAFTSCQNDDKEKQHYDNKLFISEATFAKEIKFKENDVNRQASVVVGMAKPEMHDVKATIVSAPELLSVYREAYYDDEALLLPEKFYSITENIAVIPTGSIQSKEVLIDFMNIGSLDRETVYVLPITIQSVEGTGILQSGKTLYYVFRAASLVNVVCNLNDNCAYPNFKGDSRFANLSEVTMEMLFKASAFSNEISTLMGIEENFLLRCGDSGLKPNILQIVTSKEEKIPVYDVEFETNVWYHLAVTFRKGFLTVYVNGKEMYSIMSRKNVVDLSAEHSDEAEGKPRCFWIGYSYNKERYLKGAVAEVRIWNRVLDTEEIQTPNHFYQVDPSSEGLISYWKFDEGTGSTVKDYSPSGFDLTIQKNAIWESVSLPQ